MNDRAHTHSTKGVECLALLIGLETNILSEPPLAAGRGGVRSVTCLHSPRS